MLALVLLSGFNVKDATLYYISVLKNSFFVS